jgi:hypothetical protein
MQERQNGGGASNGTGKKGKLKKEYRKMRREEKIFVAYKQNTNSQGEKFRDVLVVLS